MWSIDRNNFIFLSLILSEYAILILTREILKIIISYQYVRYLNYFDSSYGIDDTAFNKSWYR